MNDLIVGILQDEFGAKPLENYRLVEKWLLENYREADLVILPEYSMLNILAGLKPEEAYRLAEELEDSEYLSKISDLAGKLDTYMLIHFIEKSREKPRSYSSSILVEPSGKYELVYRKIHLFDAYGYRESDYLLPGKQLSKTLVIKNIMLHIAICYDIRFPELFRKYAYRGGHIVIVQAGWVKGPLKEEILDFLATSRSHENTMYLVVVNQTGKMFTGRSGVFNPFGFKELDLGFKPRYLEYALDPSIVGEARKQIPVVKHSLNNWIIEFKK
ncbi:MAG: nitrilase [Desulfurococcales archaeon ex4484_58]|nr:MAG: nitrilase [Desulfurococcales archaeon ex4484_58]